MIKRLIYKGIFLKFIFSLLLMPKPAFGQDELLSLLEDEEPETEYVKAGFKTTRVINAHSFENVAAGVLDLKISHRFGYLSGGAYELYGLDQAMIRIGTDYGITDRLMVGWGRSSVGKEYDGFVKFKLLRQSTGKVNMPLSVAAVSAMTVSTLKFADTERKNYFSSRLYYTNELIIGRKFGDQFSLQVMPAMVHRNLVKTKLDNNDVYILGVAGRQKITKRLAVNFEYHYIFDERVRNESENSLSLGLDIETGGHVFQLHFTNSTSITEKGYLTETKGRWQDGDIHFGFNVSRVFNL